MVLEDMGESAGEAVGIVHTTDECRRNRHGFETDYLRGGDGAYLHILRRLRGPGVPRPGPQGSHGPMIPMVPMVPMGPRGPMGLETYGPLGTRRPQGCEFGGAAAAAS